MDRFLKKPPAAAASSSSASSRATPAKPAPAARRPPSDEEDDDDEPSQEESEEEKMPLPARFAKKPVATTVAASASAAPAAAPARRPAAAAPPATRRRDDSDEDLSDDDDDEDDDDDASEEEEEEEEEDEPEPSDHSEEDEDDEDYSDDDGASAAGAKKFRQPRLRFDLGTFSAPQFDAGAFVSELTRELFEQQDPLDFDPSPFSILFESALERLSVLRDETDRNIALYAAEARTAEEHHKEGLANLQEQLSTVFTKFRRLDGRISSVAHTSVRIGHTLQTVDMQKKYNLQGQEIIQHFLAFHEASLLAANSAAAAQARLPAIFHIEAHTAGSASSSSANGSSLAGLKDTVPELHRAAELIQMLSAISQDLRVKGTEKASELIAKTSNDIENELISRFDRASRDKNLLDMKSHAGVLLNFRGKAIIKRYVFNVIEKLEGYCRDESKRKQSVEDEQQLEAPTTAAAVAAAAEEKSPVGIFKSSLLRLYRGVTFAVKEQCAVCSVIFPHPLSVIKSILERVFQDKIQGLIDASLGDKRLHTEEFLRMLEFAHTNTMELVANLQAAIRVVATGVAREGGGGGGGGSTGGGHHHSSSLSLSSSSATAMLLHSPASPSSSLLSSSAGSGSGPGAAGDQVQMMNLSDQVGGIFAVYRAQAHDREMELVKDVCHRLIQSTLAMEAPRSHASASGSAHAGEDETDMFGRIKKSILADQKQKWILLVLESDLVEKLCAQSIASVSRSDKLSDPPLLADHVSDLFTHIASAAMDDFLSVVLHAALEFLPAADGKTEPDPFFFQVIGLINLMVDKIALHFQLWILPRVTGGGAGGAGAAGVGSGAGLIGGMSGLGGGGGGGSLTSTGGGAGGGSNTAVILETRIRELFAHVETQICQALVRLIQSSVKHITRLLSQKQRASDYKPREDDSESVLDGKPSAACAAVCSFLQTQYASIVTSLEGKNLDKFLTILGLKAHEAFVAHLQRFSVSTMGAGLLARDMKEYQRVMGSFHLSAVLEKWSELRQLVDLFFVGPDHLRAVIADSSKLRGMDQSYLLSFISMRADFAENKKRIMSALNLKENTQAQNQLQLGVPAESNNRSRGNSARDD